MQLLQHLISNVKNHKINQHPVVESMQKTAPAINAGEKEGLLA